MGELLQRLGLERYAATFKKHKMSVDILAALTPEDWSEIGVAAIGDRRRLLNAIGKLPRSPAHEEGRFARAPPTRRGASPAHKSPVRSRSRSRSRGAAGGDEVAVLGGKWFWANRRVLVIGDSASRGFEEIFRNRGYVSPSWSFEVHDGTEALSVVIKNQDDYDLVIFVSAGNALWCQRGKKDIEENIGSFDPAKVVVVLLGSADFWIKLAGGGDAANPLFFLHARQTLRLRGVRVAQLIAFMTTLTYKDKLGHLSDDAREKWCRS